MILRPEHGALYAWARTPPGIRTRCKMRAPNINLCISLHAGERIDTVAHNILSLARLRRENGADALGMFELSKWDAANIPRRFYQYSRWRARVLANRAA